MRISMKLLAVSCVLAFSLTLPAQDQPDKEQHDQDQRHKPESTVNGWSVAKFSYDNSASVRGEEIRHLCMAVSSDGSYRVVRMDDKGLVQRLQGRISAEQFIELKKMLASAKFRELSGNGGGLILNDAQSFAAEVARVSGTQRLRWLDADGRSPFPAPVGKVVEWLKSFDASDARPFERTEFQDVCPSESYKPLQPSVAQNR